MIDRRLSMPRKIGLVTTGLVSLASAAAIGWTAATPVGRTAASGSTDLTNGRGSVRTAQQISAARGTLQLARENLARLLASEDDLPQAALANLPAVPLPTVQVPAAGAAPAAAQPAPPVQTTTGASGVVRP